MLRVSLVELCNNRVGNGDLHHIPRRVDCRFVGNSLETQPERLVGSTQTPAAYFYNHNKRRLSVNLAE
jgi:hypothetical protein